MYFILLIFTIVLYRVLEKKPTRKFKQALTVIMSIVLITISGLRNKAVGSDTGRYLYSLAESASTTWRSIFQDFSEALFNPTQTLKDPGYNVFEKCVSTFTTAQVPFLLLVALITVIPLTQFIKRNSKEKCHMLFPYMFYITLVYENLPNHTIRVSIAFALCLMAYIQLQKEKNIHFFILVLFAATIHKSSLIVLLFWLLQRFVNPKIVFYSVPLVFGLISLVPDYVVSFLDGNTGAYEVYLGGDWFRGGNAKPVLILLLMGGIYFLLFMGIYKGNIDFEKYRREIIGSSLAIVLTPVVRIDPIMFRLVSFFAPWLMVLVPVVFECFSPSIRKIAYFALYAAFFLKTYSAQEYKFYWQYMPMDNSYAKVELLHFNKIDLNKDWQEKILLTHI